MKIKKFSMFLGAAALLTVGSFVFIPQESSAACCGKYYDYDYEDDGNETVISQLSERINAMELAIIEALRLGTGQVSGNMKEQIGADSNIANAQDDRSVVQEVEKVRLEAMADSASGVLACQILTQVPSIPTIEANTIAAKAALAKELVNWDRGDESMPSRGGPEMAARARADIHCGAYATQQDIDSGLCPAGTSVGGELANANMDVNGSIFFVKNGNLSATLSPERADAAKAFQLNLINPNPQGPMAPGEAATPGGKEKAAARMAVTARYSVANDAVLDVITRREPQSDLAYADVVKATASQLSGYKGDWSNGVSLYDALDVRARSWLNNTTFQVESQSSNPAQVAKDQLMMTAFSTFIGWESFKQQEKTNLLLATAVAILNDMNRK